MPEARRGARRGNGRLWLRHELREAKGGRLPCAARDGEDAHAMRSADRQAAIFADAPGSCVSCRVAPRETCVRGSDAQFNLAAPEAQRV